MKSKLVQALAAPVAALVFAVVISALALMLSGYSPVTAFDAMLDYTLFDPKKRQSSIVAILNRSVPYYLMGLAAAIGFRMNLFNIGIIGQYQFGALIAGWVGSAVVLPALVHPIFICIVAMLTGAAVAAVPAALKVSRGISEVLSTIMLNAIVTALIAYLLRNYMRFTDGKSNLAANTKVIPPSGRVPFLNRPLSALGIDLGKGVRLHGFIIVAIVVGVLFYLILFRTRFGFDLRASGANPSAAAASGVNPKRLIFITMLISGALAALAGMAYLIADPQQFKYGDQFPAGLGITGLSVALVGRNHPAGVAVGALLFSFLERATQPLNALDIPSEIFKIMQGAFLLGAVLGYELVRRATQQAAVKSAAARTTTNSIGTASIGATT
jgi:general nucleoside transport system permease protein